MSSVHQPIFDHFRRCFSYDLRLFDAHAAEPVRRAIEKLGGDTVVWDSTTVKEFLKDNTIPAQKMTSDAEKKLAVHMNHIISTLCVYMMRRSGPVQDIYSPEKVAELTEIVKGLGKYDDVECNLLLIFRSIQQTSVKLLPGKLNKARNLFIGHHLGGSNLSMGKYATGSNQKVGCAARRVRIYENESGVLKEERPKRVASTAASPAPPQPRSSTVNIDAVSHMGKAAPKKTHRKNNTKPAKEFRTEEVPSTVVVPQCSIIGASMDTSLAASIDKTVPKKIPRKKASKAIKVLDPALKLEGSDGSRKRAHNALEVCPPASNDPEVSCKYQQIPKRIKKPKIVREGSDAVPPIVAAERVEVTEAAEPGTGDNGHKLQLMLPPMPAARQPSSAPASDSPCTSATAVTVQAPYICAFSYTFVPSSSFALCNEYPLQDKTLSAITNASEDDEPICAERYDDDENQYRCAMENEADCELLPDLVLQPAFEKDIFAESDAARTLMIISSA